MSDTIGGIAVPEITPSGTFPLVTSWPVGMAIPRDVVVHAFGAANAKLEQRYLVGMPARRYVYRDAGLSEARRIQLRDFWEARHGGEGSFTYSVPNVDGTFTNKTVCFENAPLSFEHLTQAVCSTGVTMMEIVDPASAPTYSLASRVTRFPGTTLAAALLAQEQEIIPVLKIRVVDGAVDDIFVSDRRVTIGSQLYLPRLLRIGDPGSEELLSQSMLADDIDQVRLTLGNADYVMTDLARSTELVGAWVELSFFHVGSGILIDLWAGEVVDWSDDEGSPEFGILCSDRLSALTLSAGDNCSRNCKRRFKLDGCPFDPGTDTRDLVHFPGADLATCDYGYNTPNGCMAHGVQHSYKGVFRTSQQAKILDNSSGLFGLGRSLFSSTSQVSDTLEGKPIPEIWHDDDGIASRGLPVSALIAVGREESDFYAALGVVGAGPIDAYTTPQMYDTDSDGKKETFLGVTLDGQPHHGLKVDSNGNAATGNSTLGLRTCVGTDPAGSTDYFSLGRVGTGAGWIAGPDGSPIHEVTGGGSAYYEIFGAGLAFVELRRTDPKGIQLSLPDQHEMRAMISGGLSGWSWSAPGSRGSLPRCTTPAWVAVNSLLRWLGVGQAGYAAQEAYFDVDRAIAAAALHDDVVARVFGSGTEAQFRFKGVIRDGKPARAALRDVLNCALGYYTFEFGKLVVGCRINASAVSAYTAGNMLFRSLKLRPKQVQFEKLTVEFDDEEYLYAKNTVDLTDKDYAARHRRAQAPREQRLGLMGVSTKSQAARIVTVRLREEMGGIDAAEQAAAREGGFATTLLGLENTAGDVVSLQDLRGNSAGKFRVIRWRLMRDFSVQMEVETVTDAMYDLTVGPKPADVQASPITQEMPRDANVPPAPAFGVEVNDLDPTVAEVAGIAFSDTTNTHTIASATFELYYVDPAAPDWLLGSSLSSGASSLTLASAPGGALVQGDYLQIGAELLRINAAVSGTTVPVARAQLGSSAASALAGDVVAKVLRRTRVPAFAPGFFDGGDSGDWALLEAIPETRLVSVRGWVTNAYGNSASTDVCVSGTMSHGLPLTAPAAGSTADTIVNVTNGNVTLSAGPAIVNVVATSVDCIVTLAPGASMEGQDVKVCLSPGSTFSAKTRPHSGDTIQGSGSDDVISAAGSSKVYESAGGGDWAIVASGGTVVASPVPDAPNVLSTTTAAVTYGLIGNASAYGFSASIDLPVSDPDYAHLKKIHIVRVVGSDLRELDTLYGPWGSSPVPWNYAVTFAQDPLSPISASIEFLCENDDGQITASPVSKSVTVRASFIASVSAAEAGTPYAEPVNRLVHTYIDIVPVFNGNQVPQNATYWFSDDGGTTYRYVGWGLVTSVGAAIRLDVLKPGANTTYKVAVAAGPLGGDPAKKIAAADLPGTAVLSSGFTVTGLALPAASAVTTAAVGAAVNVTDPDGHQYVSIPAVTWIDPTDANAAFWAITVQCVDSGGSAAPADQGGTEVLHRSGLVSAGASRTTDEALLFDYNPAGSTYTYLQYRLYVLSRKSNSTSDWSDATKSQLQTSAWSAAAYKRVNFGSLPAGALDLRRSLDASLGAGMYKDASGRPKVGISGNPANMLANSGFEDGLSGWTNINALGGIYSVYGSFSVVTTPVYSGSKSISTTVKAYLYQEYTVKPGEVYYAETYYQSTGGAAGSAQLAWWFVDAAGAILTSGAMQVGAASTSWAKLSGVTAAAPAGVAALRLFVGVQDVGSGVSGTWYVDGAVLFRQVPTGDGMQADGSGGVKAKVAGGARIDGSGNIAVSPGVTLQVDGSGNLQVVGLVRIAGLPSLPSGAYPAGAVILNTLDNKMYRNPGGSAWIVSTAPGDLVAGAIASGVTLNAAQVNAGTFNGFSFVGCTLDLNLNGVQTTINNAFDSSWGDYMGLKIRDTSTSTFMALNWYSLVMMARNGISAGSVRQFWNSVGGYGYGYLHLFRTDTLGGFVLDSSTSRLRINGSNVLGPQVAAIGTLSGLASLSAVISKVNQIITSVLGVSGGAHGLTGD
jgi:hypothetical protein